MTATSFFARKRNMIMLYLIKIDFKNTKLIVDSGLSRNTKNHNNVLIPTRKQEKIL
ncbi:hypothetical protein [Spiroplasma poulsonii]|uniref:hypothetical protein n=1 Tax=Spiroplasma poulsonii TaxID=2138 RepID=UPI001F4CDBBA|nr:hypothetical protein [Spiroplasma poulsonii]UNF62098.1 hypothetical protein MNU24_01130 [Spiroplasma poulsonii]